MKRAVVVELGPHQKITLDAIRQVLPTLCLQNDEMLTNRIGREKLDEIAADIFGFIQVGVAGDLTQDEQMALACQLLRCLTKYIKLDMRLPVTLKTLVDGISLLPHSVDQSFPGYFENRLLKYTILPKAV